MRAVAPLTDVLERVHAPAVDTDAWLEDIRVAASSAFEGHIGAQSFLVRLHPHGVDTLAVARGAPHAVTIRAAHRAAGPEAAEAYRAGPVMRGSKSVPRGHPSREIAQGVGVGEVLTSAGFADGSRACIVSFLFEAENAQVSRHARTVLGRLSAHLGAAYRLRLRAGEPSDADAVLSSNGTVLHASEGAKGPRDRERLRQAALGVARAKRESARDPAAGLAFWTAMVDGRWTLVERIDTDGKRLLFARRNAPEAIKHRALTERECGVLERASLGCSIRYVAYELGLAESTVSETLSRAMKRLGVQSRAELVELRSMIAPRGEGGEPCTPSAL